MSRVFVSESTGAEVYVFANDHCPPHVHARHRGEGWVARVRFSYLRETVELWSIAPTQNVPLRRVINGLLDDVQARLADCRQSWWTTRQTTCLTNQWALVRPDRRVELCTARTTGAKQITEARYEPSSGRLEVRFRERITIEVKS
ncbi:MAG: hypothetical protein ACREUT_17980 [Steroidobacteraceae bacterium]